ncbi:MAG TPA: hypothetical protein VF176_01400 [Solirubrobacterales bacterium]
MTRVRLMLFALAIASVALGVGAGPASATFHLIALREVYPGSGAYPDAEYVELQAYAPGQNFVQGHSIAFFDAAGASLGTVSFGADAARGADQVTFVAATPLAESQFGIVADTGMSGGRMDPSGGAVCWEALDCVSWGSFHGSVSSATGAPADPLGLPDGMALRRSIAPGCPTLLEATDDSNDSAADFFDAFPAPRPNSVPPSEHRCSSQGGDAGGGNPASGDAGGGSGQGRPQTRLLRHPGRVTRDRTPTFRFTSNRPRSTFRCKLDGGRFKRCRSPLTTPLLSPGDHAFRVKARAGGVVDRSPAIWRFEVKVSSSPRP